jgi:hypothetical protein
MRPIASSYLVTAQLWNASHAVLNRYTSLSRMAVSLLGRMPFKSKLPSEFLQLFVRLLICWIDFQRLNVKTLTP